MKKFINKNKYLLYKLDENFGDQKFSGILKTSLWFLYEDFQRIVIEFQKISDLQIFHLMYMKQLTCFNEK